jgi:N-acetylmuramidase
LGDLVDLVGTGRRLTSAELLAAADKLGVDVATLRAILQVETAGAGFDAKKRLKLLFEPHIFYRQLGPGPKRNEAVKKGLAYAKARTRPYPPLSKRYDQIAAAIAIDETAAVNSASWGLPQIMGFNHRAAGFQSAKAMVTSMLEGEGQQLEAFTNLLSDWKLTDALRNRDWRRFALKYNGPNALKHGYDKSLRAAFEKYSRVAARAVVKPGTNKSFVFLSGF